MTIERTLSIMKPDAIAGELIGEIYSRFTADGLRIVAARMTHLSKQQVEEFYAEHKERHFFQELLAYMLSGPVMISVLEGEDAVARQRELMGATKPALAVPGSIRYDLARDGDPDENAVHGSDSRDSAKREIAFFFKEGDIYSGS
jgi:nucleoside-diphosphate kinase